MEQARQAFDYRDNPWMMMMGLDRQFASDPVIEENLDELISGGWLEAQSPLMLSQKGKKYLQRKNKGRGKPDPQTFSKKDDANRENSADHLSFP